MTTGFVETHAAEGFSHSSRRPLSLCLLQPPGEFGADIAVVALSVWYSLRVWRSSCSLLATRSEYKRQVPGRIVGVSRMSMASQRYV